MEEEEKKNQLTKTESDDSDEKYREKKIKALNALVVKQNDSTPGFTENVNEMIKTLGSDEEMEATAN